MADIEKPSHPLRVFLCHSSADKPAVRDLYQRLLSDGFKPWLDEEDLIPGQDWHTETLKAVRKSDVVIVCLSQDAINKASHVQKEVRIALDLADEQPEGAIFVIPLKFEDCQIPERLSHLQPVDFFGKTGYEELTKALLIRADSIASAASSPQEFSASTVTDSSTQPQIVNQSGGVSFDANNATVGQDVVGRDKIININVESGARVVIAKPNLPFLQPDIPFHNYNSTSDSATGVEPNFNISISEYEPPSVLTAENTIGISDIDFEHGFLFLHENALTISDLTCIYKDTWIPLPTFLAEIKERYLVAKEKEAARLGLTLDNNLSYSLRGVRVERVQDASGNRRNRYVLNIEPTDYFNFIFPNLVLDESMEINGIQTTPRQALGMSPSDLIFENLRGFPCHFRIGTQTVFITSDNQIVVSIRAARQMEAGGLSYHASTAEGMLRPADEREGAVSPFYTCTRSLKDELGLELGIDYTIDDIRCLGILLDISRAQPIIPFYAKSSRIKFETLRQRWLFRAKDKHENQNIIGLAWSDNNARRLVGGPILYQDKRVNIASNHAMASLYLAALQEFGAHDESDKAA
jgi:hypothetical protein